MKVKLQVNFNYEYKCNNPKKKKKNPTKSGAIFLKCPNQGGFLSAISGRKHITRIHHHNKTRERNHTII